MHGIETYLGAEVRKKETKAPRTGTPGDEKYIHFALEDLVKKAIRFTNRRSEKDMAKLTLWAYLLWMRL